MIDLPLVLVEWVDSSQPVGRWQWLDEYDGPHVCECVSVGFLVADGDAELALAPNIATSSRIQMGGVISIPRSAVRRMIVLKTSGKVRRERNNLPAGRDLRDDARSRHHSRRA